MLFEDKANCLEVYNALNMSNYKDENMIEIVTLENGIVLSVRNDAAFVIGNYLNIYEHQSTYNPNMPVRCLLYYVETIKPQIKKSDIYSRTLVGVPNPKFVVFYNGKEKRPEVEEMHLSSAYYNQENDNWLEMKCMVYNINEGCNKELLDKCKSLREYMLLIDKIKDNINKDNDLDTAIDSAVIYCIDNDILRDFLSKRGNEVRKVAALDYTFERRAELIKEQSFREGAEQGREQGREEGRAETQVDNAKRMIALGMSVGQIAACLGISEEEVKELKAYKINE